jgi:DNA-binding response OmpR family regulator
MSDGRAGDGSINVLYIEDNAANYRLVHRLLSQAGFEVFWAEDGAAGFDSALQARPDLILMDINLPGLSGLELASKFRAQSEFRDTPIIAVSARNQRADKETALVAGCSGFIPKPIDPFTFVSQVKAYLGGRTERLDRATEGRALRQFNVQLLDHLEQQLLGAQEANLKLLDTQQTLEAKNRSLARLVALGQDMVREHDPWRLLPMVLRSLFLEVPFDAFAAYIQHPSGAYWEGLRLEGGGLAPAPVMHPDHPFAQRLLGVESEDGWLHGPPLLAMPIWTDGYQADLWLANGQPCLFLDIDRLGGGRVRSVWAFDRKADRPFLTAECEMVRLYGQLAHVCLANAEMIREMDEKSRALSSSYERLERAYTDLRRAKTELHEKDKHDAAQNISVRMADRLSAAANDLERSTAVVMASVRGGDPETEGALRLIARYAKRARALFHALLRHSAAAQESPEWIDLQSFITEELVYMELEGTLTPDQIGTDLDIKGLRVYGVHSDFARLLRTMVLNSAPDRGSAPAALRAWREGGDVCLELADSAGEMPRAALDRAFEPFQADAEPGARAPHPALTACRQILATYGGGIEIRNAGAGVALKATIAVGE